MDRLAAAIAWNDAQSREQAILVASVQDIEGKELQQWFPNEGENAAAFSRFQKMVDKKRDGRE